MAEAGRLFGWRSSGGWCRGRHWRWRHGLSFAHDGDASDDDRGDWLVVGVAFDAGDGGDEKGGMCVALAEDGVLAVELRNLGLSDEELRAVGSTARWTRAGVGHGEEAW